MYVIIKITVKGGCFMEGLIIAGLALAAAATVFICVKVLPKKYDGRFGNKFLQLLHDYFNFKTFYVEALTKFIFVLLTCACIFVGFLLIFGKFEYYGYFGMKFTQSTFLYGLGIMLLGPLALRVTYEFVMMAILLVQNVMSINRRLKAPAQFRASPAPSDAENDDEIITP